jgi:16S rRNA G966 N2-methylase RsmD
VSSVAPLALGYDELERWPSREFVAHDAQLVHADAIVAMRRLCDAGARAALVYIDPPFALGRSLSSTIHFDTGARSGELERWRWSDAWGGLDVYLAFMEQVLVGVHALLCEDGSLLLHCDHHAAPYLAVLCDRIFGSGDRGAESGAAGFRNELIWSYGLGGSSGRCYPKKHDTIFWYTRGRQWTFLPPMTEATSARLRGQQKKAPDVFELPSLNNMALERTGYPTQKPLALLERLITAHSNTGDVVVDLFGGSGTTALAATRLGRRAISVDASREAIALQRDRLIGAGFGASVYGTLDTDAAPLVLDVTTTSEHVELRVNGEDPPLALVALGTVDGATFCASAWWYGGRRASDGVWRDVRDVVRLERAATYTHGFAGDIAGRSSVFALS